MKQHICKPCENVYNCFWSRPALVLFTAGLCLMGIAFVYMSSYVMKNDQIINKNIKTNWNEFLTDISKLNWCTDESDWIADCSQAEPSSDQFRYTDAFETGLNITKVAKQLAKVAHQTFVWTTFTKKLLPREDLVDERALVRLTLVVNPQPEGSETIPKNQLWSIVTATVVLQSNKTLKLPNSKRPNAVNATQILARDKMVQMCDCKSAVSTSRLPFHVSHEADPQLEIYFNMEERTNIHLHLMSTSYFLFTTAMIVILYGFLRRRTVHHDGNTAHIDAA